MYSSDVGLMNTYILDVFFIYFIYVVTKLSIVFNVLNTIPVSKNLIVFVTNLKGILDVQIRLALAGSLYSTHI